MYESVVKGVGLFKNSGANAIIAIGGGSAIDVAIDLYLDIINIFMRLLIILSDSKN